MVGDGPLAERAETLAGKLGLGNRIRFFGSRDDVASFMQAADIFVMTSKTEGTPAVVLEAGYMGLPVVATRVGGLPECVFEDVTGVLIDPDSEEEMAREIRRVASDSELRSKLGENAKRWVRENLVIDQVADRYLEFYRKVRGDGVLVPVES
jgi:glycosyltransferase involved in cell wall biosynthesis